MGIFSRIGDILGSNINAMLEKAEDPEKIARLIIQEMEDTLVEVRTAAARSIADKKELNRQLTQLEASAAEWEAKAALAVEKGREDLARGALTEKQRYLRKADALREELVRAEEAIGKADADMSKLQAKLDEAKAKHQALAVRRQSAERRVKIREQAATSKVDDALARYATVERHVDELEAKAEAFDLGKQPTLDGEFAALEAEEAVEKELQAIKARVRTPSAPPAQPAPAFQPTPPAGDPSTGQS